VKYVNYPATAISDRWLKRAQKAAKTAEKKSSAQASTYIASRSAVWSDLKPELEKLSSGKCWYTEARDKVSFWHVDHFRPKSVYPWLAFTWTNLRLCGGMPNVQKLNEFPLLDDATRATVAKPSTDHEIPLLLDPVRWGDPELLTFNGAGEPTAARPQEETVVRRVAETIRLLDLNTEKLCASRREKWRRCERKLKDLRRVVEEQRHQHNTDAGHHLVDLCRDLDELYSDSAEFTATAWACARELNAEAFVKLAREIAVTAP
jgi:uncharacterized protein (TIGR02646 family)